MHVFVIEFSVPKLFNLHTIQHNGVGGDACVCSASQVTSILRCILFLECFRGVQGSVPLVV